MAGQPSAGPATLPSVAVVIPTHDRPVLVRETVASVLAQDYPGRLDVVVVHDRAVPDPTLAQGGARPVHILVNDRTPGLCGARNTGILAVDTELVAFCDDDDVWQPTKLSRQVGRLLESPQAEMASTAMTVVHEGRETIRLAGRDTVRHDDLVGSRMSMLHSSSFLLRRSALVGGLGMLDEDIPGGQNEDWELLLRASRRHDIAHLDEPLVSVRWGRSSFFSRQWQGRIDSLSWMLARYPEIAEHPVGGPRVQGQVAFGLASLGRRREAMAVAWATWRRRPQEWRAPVALVVATGVVSGERVLQVLHRFGRGV